MQCLNTSDEAIELSLKGNPEIEKDDKVEEAQSQGELAPSSAYTLRGNDVGWSELWSELKNGTGPERDLFRNDHPMVQELKNSWIVTEARMKFFSLGGEKPLKRWDAPFGIPGIGFSYSMTEQFIGGARVTIIPAGGGYYYQVDDTKNRNSLIFHLPVENPNRVPGQTVPYGTTYQRYVWFEQ